jgi:glycosyltransferase involved in cell wall biosynthesis
MTREPKTIASDAGSAQGAPPLVTVLMAVHDCAAFVDEAIGSILRQTFGDFEFLIIDDASTDGTRDRIAAYTDGRIRSFRNEARLGLTRSLNRGLSLARGTLIARQDGDDRSYPSRLQTQVECFGREPELVVLGTQAQTIDGRGSPVARPGSAKLMSNRAIRWQLLFDNPFIHTSVMFRKREVWGSLGGYDETFRTSQDFALWSRAAAAGFRMRNLASTLVDFRVHEDSVSGRYTPESRARVRAVFLNTIVTQLGPEAVPEGWPDVWIRFSNARLFPDADDSLETVARDVVSIYRRFIEKNTGAADDDEIRRHVTSLLIWLAHSSAGRGRRSSLSSLARAFRFDRRMTLRAAPRYLAHLAVGSWRSRARTDATRKPAAS